MKRKRPANARAVRISEEDTMPTRLRTNRHCDRADERSMQSVAARHRPKSLNEQPKAKSRKLKAKS